MSRRDLFTAPKKAAVERMWWQNGFTRLAYYGIARLDYNILGDFRLSPLLISSFSPFALKPEFIENSTKTG